ncbi:MAG: hypothetical protein Q7K55_06880 [Candidatus Levybacteria bacterium]|nr:hypothetical protein [Candidatus Levybacteria bacterium]
MKILFLCFAFLIAVFFEGAVISVPLVLDFILVYYVFERKAWIFALAFILGLILDIFHLRLLGATSIFFAVFIFIITLYERKFEIKTTAFVLFFSFIGSLIFLFIFKYNYVLQQALISSLIAILIFKIFGRIERKNC